MDKAIWEPLQRIRALREKDESFHGFVLDDCERQLLQLRLDMRKPSLTQTQKEEHQCTLDYCNALIQNIESRLLSREMAQNVVFWFER